MKNSTLALLCFILTMSFLLLLNSNNTFATTSSLSLSINNSTVSVDIAPTQPTGTFKKSVANTISAFTDNATGYTLRISAPTDAGADYDKLINTSDNTAKLTSISTATTEDDFKATASTAYNNSWGYLPSVYCPDGTSSSCNTNTSFLPAPTIAGDVIDATTTANLTANTYDLTLGTRIDPSTTPGSYSNTFVITAVANATPYTITYNANGGSGAPANVDTATYDEIVTLSSTAPTRTNYIYLGWCTVVPTNNNGTDTCTGGTEYQPSANITLDQTSTGNNFYLYAMWQKIFSMQEFAAGTANTTCSAMTIGDTLILIDSRDNQQYTIAKLKDSKCWMAENLNLAGGTALSADNTNVTSAYISSFSTSNRLTKSGSTIVLPASSTSGFSTDNYSYVYNSGNKTNCGTLNQSAPCYSYYSWDAATLGSGRSFSSSNNDAPHSICPKGWRLPTSYYTSKSNWRTASDFYVLAHQYGLDSTTSVSENDRDFYDQAGPGTIPNFTFAGFYNNQTLYDGGSQGVYWSSTSDNSSNHALNLSFTTVNITATFGNARHLGFSIRCLFSGQ